MKFEEVFPAFKAGKVISCKAISCMDEFFYKFIKDPFHLDTEDVILMWTPSQPITMCSSIDPINLMYDFWEVVDET